MTMKVQLFICALYIFVENAHSDEIETIVKSVCGENRNCFGGENSQIPLNSCCRPCECEDVCLEKRTCCADKYASNSKNVTKQICSTAVSYRKSHKDYRQFPRYFVRAKCPESYEDERTRRKCEDHEPESLLDIPFVSSNDGGVVYKNRHCAECFGERDTVPWKIMVDWSCMKSVYWDFDGNKVSLNQTFLTTALLKRCTLPFIRPRNTNWKQIYCHDDERLISSCNSYNPQKNGFQYSVYNKLRGKCNNDKSALIFVHGMGRFGYSNVYCYLCNKGNEPTWACDGEEPFRLMSSFSFIMSTNSMEDKTPVGKHTCSQYEYHDRFFGVCRYLHCPILRYAKQGKCESAIYQSSSILNFKLEFKLSANVRKEQNDNETRAFAKELPTLLQNVLQLQGCEICHIRVMREKRNTSITEIYTSWILTTTPKCVEKKVLSTVATMQENQIVNKNEFIKWKQISYRVEYVPSEKTYKSLSQNAKQIYFNGMSRCQYLPSSKLENCAKIYLTTEEFNEIANTSDAGNVSVIKLKNGDVEICVSDFEAITNGKCSEKVKTGFVMFLLISVTVLFI